MNPYCFAAAHLCRASRKKCAHPSAIEKEDIMYKFKNSLIAFGGLSLLIGAIALVTPHRTQGQGGDTVGPPKPVKVVNTPAEPVPVTGTTTITGDVTLAPGTSVATNNTPTVNVGNIPTVQVGNPVDAPVPVRDTENPARQPYQTSFNPRIADFPTVPDGKLFVIEYVSGRILTETPLGTDPPCRLLVFGFGTRPDLSSSILEHYFTPTLTGSVPGVGSVTVSTYIISQQTRLYAGSRTGFARFASAGPVCGPNTFEGRITLSGYLVDVP